MRRLSQGGKEMKKCVFFLLIAMLGSPWILAGEAKSSEDGFVPLFNGKNLDGWVNVNCAPSTWSVRDGMIVCTGKPTGVMRTTRQYENFILELEWRHIVKRGNAGLFVHSYPVTARGVPFTRSIEIQIMDGNHGDVFAIHGATLKPDPPHPRGWMRALPTEKHAYPAGGRWNHYRVESRDGHISLAVNGKVVTKASECNPRKGYICLESEGSEVHFRNIRVKELPSSNPPPYLVAEEDRGFHSLYTGVDLVGWRQDPGHRGHWVVKDWVLDYDGKSEARDKDLWSEKEYKDFILIVDWRFPGKPQARDVPVVLPDGNYEMNPDGTQKTVTVPDAGDGGIYVRGNSKSQINIWCWPIGSGEVYGYRTDKNMPPEVRRGVTPIVNADKPLGQWNRFEITMKGDRLSVKLNEKEVLKEARLPGVPERGPIALQHHGDPIQFANIYIKELN